VIGFSSNHPGGGIGAGRDDASSVDNPNKPPSFVEGPPSVVGVNLKFNLSIKNANI
jgi:hypothetical protein